MLDEPLDDATVRRLLREAQQHGRVAFSTHALQEMAKDGLGPLDVRTALRAGVDDGCDFIDRTWRYRRRIPHCVVVVRFPADDRAEVVTAWRLK